MSDARKKSWGMWLARVLALAYLAGLVLVPLAFRFIGERSWIVTIAIYLPRIGFFLPLPFVVGLCLLTRQWLLAATVAVLGTFIVVFPLMGYKLGGRDENADRSLRVMTWNTFFGRTDNQEIRRRVIELKPDIFLGQAIAHRTKDLFRDDPGGYVLEFDDEFMLASRYPVLEKYVAPPFDPERPSRGPNFVRYTLDTPLGPIDVFNIHPRSPRNGMDAFRGRGLRTRIISGDLPDDVQPIDENTALRRRQVEAVVAAIHAAKHPLVVAGDTNLPPLSWLFHTAFGALHDGFSEAGSGLGYTFPVKRPWMRIDRIMSDDHFRFLRFTVGEVVASDHHYVIADLAKAEGGSSP